MNGAFKDEFHGGTFFSFGETGEDTELLTQVFCDRADLLMHRRSNNLGVLLRDGSLCSMQGSRCSVLFNRSGLLCLTGF